MPRWLIWAPTLYNGSPPTQRKAKTMKAQHTWSPTSTLLLVFGCLLFSPTSAEPETGKVIGSLKFGMTPKEVEALPECSSGTECLYEVADKNRYFTLFYQPNHGTISPQSATEPGPDAQLALIDIDMGLYTKEWYGELQRILANQYPITHPITEQASGAFQERNLNELDLGLADAAVLLKVVRRPFGNLVLRLIFQNEEAATEFRKKYGAGAGL